MVLGRVESETRKWGSGGSGFSTSNHTFRKIFEILEAYWQLNRPSMGHVVEALGCSAPSTPVSSCRLGRAEGRLGWGRGGV